MNAPNIQPSSCKIIDDTILRVDHPDNIVAAIDQEVADLLEELDTPPTTLNCAIAWCIGLGAIDAPNIQSVMDNTDTTDRQLAEIFILTYTIYADYLALDSLRHTDATRPLHPYEEVGGDFTNRYMNASRTGIRKVECREKFKPYIEIIRRQMCTTTRGQQILQLQRMADNQIERNLIPFPPPFELGANWYRIHPMLRAPMNGLDGTTVQHLMQARTNMGRDLSIASIHARQTGDANQEPYTYDIDAVAEKL